MVMKKINRSKYYIHKFHLVPMRSNGTKQSNFVIENRSSTFVYITEAKKIPIKLLYGKCKVSHEYIIKVSVTHLNIKNKKFSNTYVPKRHSWFQFVSKDFSRMFQLVSLRSNRFHDYYTHSQTSVFSNFNYKRLKCF